MYFLNFLAGMFRSFFSRPDPMPPDELMSIREQLARMKAAEAARAEAETKAGDRFDRHLRNMSFVVSVVGVLVTLITVVFGWMANSNSKDAARESHEAAKEMREEFAKLSAKQEADFRRLAGDALKVPKLEILHQGIPLDGTTLETDPAIGSVRLELSLKNSGDKKAEDLTLRLFSKHPITVSEYREDGGDAIFPYRFSPYHWNPLPAFVAAGDTVRLQDPVTFAGVAPGTNATCKLQIFYSGVSSVALFSVRGR